MPKTTRGIKIRQPVLKLQLKMWGGGFLGLAVNRMNMDRMQTRRIEYINCGGLTGLFQYQYQYQSWIYIAHKRKASNALISTTNSSGPLVLRHGRSHHFRILSIRQQDL